MRGLKGRPFKGWPGNNFLQKLTLYTIFFFFLCFSPPPPPLDCILSFTMTRFLAAENCDENATGKLVVGEQEIWPVNGSLDVLRSTFTNSIWNTSPTVTFKVQLSWHKPLFMAYSTISLWKRHKHGQLQKEAQHTRDVNTYDLQTLCYARAKAHVCHFLGSTKQDSGVPKVQLL